MLNIMEFNKEALYYKCTFFHSSWFGMIND